MVDINKLKRGNSELRAIELARRDDMDELIAFLRNRNVTISQAGQEFLADLFDGKIKRPRGKPKLSELSPNQLIAHYRKMRAVPVHRARDYADRLLDRYHRRCGKKRRKYIRPNGASVVVVDDVCRRAVRWLERTSGGRETVTVEAVIDLRKRPKARQR